jgi:hypothetical protein
VAGYPDPSGAPRRTLQQHIRFRQAVLARRGFTQDVVSQALAALPEPQAGGIVSTLLQQVILGDYPEADRGLQVALLGELPEPARAEHVHLRRLVADAAAADPAAAPFDPLELPDPAARTRNGNPDTARRRRARPPGPTLDELLDEGPALEP